MNLTDSLIFLVFYTSTKTKLSWNNGSWALYESILGHLGWFEVWIPFIKSIQIHA